MHELSGNAREVDAITNTDRVSANGMPLLSTSHQPAKTTVADSLTAAENCPLRTAFCLRLRIGRRKLCPPNAIDCTAIYLPTALALQRGIQEMLATARDFAQFAARGNQHGTAKADALQPRANNARATRG